MGSDQHQVDDRIEPLERLQPPYRGGKLGACRRGQKTPGERVELGVQYVVGRSFLDVGLRERALCDLSIAALEVRFDAAVTQTGSLAREIGVGLEFHSAAQSQDIGVQKAMVLEGAARPLDVGQCRAASD